MTATRTTRLLAVFAVCVSATFAVVTPAQPAGAAVASCTSDSSMGNRLPVLFVHGFTSSASTWKSDLGPFCTARTFSATFNYGPWNDDWVTNPHLGTALAARILALAADSRGAGGAGKVFVIAHSLGGLVTRCAADGRCAGPIAAAPAGQAGPVAKALADVVTFDTPNLGSFLLGQGASLLRDIAGPVGSGLCSGLQYASKKALDLNVAAFCNLEQEFLTSAAAHAFTPGSAQQLALPGQPTGTPVLALAGQVNVKVHLLLTTVNITTGDPGDNTDGDLVVSKASALAQTHTIGLLGGTKVLDCGTLNFGFTVDLNSWRCWHGEETSDPDWLAAAQSQVNTYLAVQAAANAPWTAPVVEITPTSLGAVHIGMKQAQAEAAAHAKFSQGGDQEVENNLNVPLDPHNVVGGISCLGAGTAPGTKVVTAEGFVLGQSVDQLKAIYGSRLTYFDDSGGYAPAVGYALREPGGVINFLVNGSTVFGAAAGPDVDPTTPC